MNISHFKHLPSHKYPVLQLYRRILRHVRNSPLPDNICLDLQTQASLIFKQNKNMMSGHIARNMILEGYTWENTLRDFILNPSNKQLELKIKNYLSDQMERHELKLKNKKQVLKSAQEKNSSTLRPPLEQSRLNDYNQSGLLPSGSNSQTPTKSNPNPCPSLESFRKSHTILVTRRDKTIKRMASKRAIPSRAQLDPVYLDLFLAPQEYNNRHNFLMNRRRIRETSAPGKIRISTISTPRGPYSYLKVAGRYSQHRITRANHILRLLKDRQLDKLKDVQFMISLAETEAKWEYYMTTPHDSNHDLMFLTQQWTAPLISYRDQLIATRDKQKQSLMAYRKVHISHKHLLEQTMKKKHLLAIERWAKYTPCVLHQGRLSKMSRLSY